MGGKDTARSCTTCGTPAEAQSRFCAMCGASLSAVADHDGVRRHVVVLFADLEGFTSISEGLDPEVLRSVMDRYFRLAARVIWDHGGTTEKFIGDAVMAVFGLPQVREDDALRAVRAAGGLVAELGALNAELADEYGLHLRVRVGVHAGPVSASYDAGGNLRVVGDVVNTASRLQSAAAPGQVLVGEAVAQVVRPHVTLEAAGPLALKGKEAPVRAWRVVDASPVETPARRAPMVGRDVEMVQLRAAYQRTVARGRGAVVTVLGPPGIGKSRLIEEFRAELDDPHLTVLSGRAHSYGRGLTYQPVVEMLASARAAWTAFEARAAADPTAARVLSCLACLSTRDSGSSGPGAEVEEIAWALRTFVAYTAQRCPVLLLWEDLHWAEPTLLDVIEYLADELADLPVMQVCVARPELLEQRPAWCGGNVRALTLELAPLTDEECVRLVAELAGEVVAHDLDGVCEQVALACEGNPMFAELMLDTLDEDGGVTAVPHGVQAVLAARLDRLDADDRLVLEMAATVGREFTLVDLEHLLAADSRPGVDLAACVDRLRQARLVTGSRLSTRHSFAQALGRDTTYELTAKRDRLRWHVALADAPTGPPGGVGGLGGVGDGGDRLAYHLEAAALLARELRPAAPDTRELAARAAAALAGQAADARDRKDLRAAARLFERALQVLPAGAPDRLVLALRLSDTWLGLGEHDRALAVLDQQGVDGPVVEVQREMVHLRAGRRTAEQVLDAERALEPLLGADDLARCRFHQLRAHRHLMCERIGAAEADLSAALVRARAAGDGYEQDTVRRAAGELAVWGPTPVREGLDLCAELAGRFAGSRVSLVPILGATGGLLAMDGQFDRAREALETAVAYAGELRMRGADIGLAHIRGLVESLAGDHQAAAAHFDRARAALADAGHAEGAALLAAYAARELVVGGAPVPRPYDTMGDAEIAAVTDPRTGALTAVLCMHAALAAGDQDRAAARAERAVAAAARMDDPYFQGMVYEDVAAAYTAAGRAGPARAAADLAGERFAAKGARAALERVEALRARLAHGEGR
jgi:class 3 adenylate cyclase/tetratricopeptide (TPR) repeat protein